MSRLADIVGRRTAVAASLVLLLGTAGPSLAQDETQPVLEGDYSLHDPTVTIVDGTYIAYGTGQEGGIHRGAIRIKTSPDGITWSDAGAIGRGIPDWIEPEIGHRPRNLWAPAVTEHNGRHYIYYSASTFGLQNSAIGLMTNDALDPNKPGEGWVDQGMVVESDGRSDFNAIDAFRIDTSDGRAWMSFGSYWNGIRLLELDPESGLPLDPDAELIPLASRNGGAVEASSILEHDGKFYLFVSYDRCCAGVASTYRIMVGRAEAIEGPYLSQDGRPMLEGRATQVQRSKGRYIGPGGQEVFLGPDGVNLLYHFYDGDDFGKPKMQITPILWSEDGWPELPALPTD